MKVEEALKIYRKALQYQKDGDRENAHKEYDALFNIEVLNLSQNTGLPPAAESLKYVAFKNHALLLLSDLNHEKESIDLEEFDERVNIVIDEFSEALLYDSDEDLFLELLYSICMSLGYFRIARLCLECIIQSPSRPASLCDDFMSGKVMSPNEYRIVKNYFQLCDKLNDKSTLTTQHATAELAINMEFLDERFSKEESFEWLSKSTYAEFKSHKFTSSGTISVSSADWASILDSVQSFVANLASKSKRKLTIEDPYNNSTKSINSITFELPVAEQSEETTPPLPMEVDSGGEVEEVAAKPQEDAPQSATTNGTASAEPLVGQKKKRRKSFDEAQRSRTSKRVRARTDEKQSLEDIDLTEDESFFSQITSFLTLCDEQFATMTPIFLNNDDTTKSDLFINDFRNLALTWEDDQGDLLNKVEAECNNKTVSKKPLLSQLIDTSGSTDKMDSVRPGSIKPSQFAASFIEKVNSTQLHVQELRVEILRNIMAPDMESNFSSMSELWPLATVETLKKMVEQCEPQLSDFSRQAVFKHSPKEVFAELSIAQTVLEMITDTYLSAVKVLRAPDLHGKQLLKDMEYVRSSSPPRYVMWRRIFGDLVQAYSDSFSNLKLLILRHEWTNVLMEQIDCDESWENLEDFEAIEKDIQALDSELEYSYPNFPTIPSLSLSSVKNQISKVKALATLAQVFAEPANNHSDSDIDATKVTTSRIALLESVLLPEQGQDTTPEYKAISDYFVDAPLKLRSQFWTILLSDYSSIGESQKSLDGYLMLLSDTINEFTGDQYRSGNDSQRLHVLLRSIYLSRDIIGNIMDLLQTDNLLVNNVKPSNAKSYLSSVIKLLRMLHIFILYSDAVTSNVVPAPTSSSWEKMSKLCKELIVYGWCLFYLLFRANIPESSKTPEIMNDMLSIIHEQLGTRGYCDMCNGVLLDLSLKELMRLKFSESDADLLQCLHCRYGIVMAQEDFHPYDHYTTPEAIDKKSALLLVDFVMRLVLKKKNMSQNILRADVKGVLDQLNDAIGLPDPTSHRIEKSNATLNNLLNSNISISFLQECFNGKYLLDITNPSPELTHLGASGFYYILGQTRMALFRIKKRTLPGRTEDVSEAIKFFKCALMTGCANQFETWYGLSQAYDALVEDDLTYTTYKINFATAREAVGVRQRKAIISCAIAVNCYLQNGPSKLFYNTPAFQNLIGTAWSFFARLLFNSVQPPLQMDAFAAEKERLLCGPDGLYSLPTKHTIKPKTVLKLALLCLRLASKEPSTDWYDFYLKGMCLNQLKSSPESVLDAYVKSMELCPNKSPAHGDPVLEPHYKFVSALYKYVRDDKLSVEDATKYLKLTPYYDDSTKLGPTKNGPEKDAISGVCLSTLFKIKAGDKKKWHHRPTYRISKILDEAGEVSKAKDEFSTLFQLKSNSKQPIHIWKTEFERPGQHFEYVNQYVKYFISLLERTNDIYLFGVLSKSLRKFTSGMVDHQTVWELLCTTAARILKEKLEIPAKFNDNTIPHLLFADFEKVSAKMNEIAESEEALHPLFKYLNYAAELRRLNNGFGSTAALDDLFVALYLTIYQDYATNILPKKEAMEPAAAKEESASAPPELDVVAPAAVHASTKISVMDLLSQPSTPAPVSKPSTPVSSAPAKPASNTPTSGKIRVTRRDIISKALALLRAALPKLMQGDNSKIDSPAPSTSAKESPGVADARVSGRESTEAAKADSNGNGAAAAIPSEEKLKELLEKKTGTPSTPDSSKQKVIKTGSINNDEEAETVPSTPVHQSSAEDAVKPGTPSVPDDHDVIMIGSASPSPVKPKPQQGPEEEEEPRPQSKKSDWLSTIL